MRLQTSRLGTLGPGVYRDRLTQDSSGAAANSAAAQGPQGHTANAGLRVEGFGRGQSLEFEIRV